MIPPWPAAPRSGGRRLRAKQILTPALYAARLLPLLQPLDLKILIEPGRFLVGNAGILVTRVEYVKQTGDKKFIIVDAAMNDLIRPALYDAYHEIVPVNQRRTAGWFPATWLARFVNRRISFARTASCRRWRRAICWPCSAPGHTVSSWPPTTTPARWPLKF